MADICIAPLNLRNNYLFHGPGGCGKTMALRNLQLGVPAAYTAATGVAAINLPNGSTLHRWAGIGLARESAPALAAKVRRDARLRWLTVKVLIIDEISMIGAELFDKLDYIARYIRDIDIPFGGITLVLSGDFLQLSPINDNWVFKSKVWNELNLHVVHFTNMIRFVDRPYFEMLLRARKGCITDEDVEMLRGCTRKLTGDILPTVLYARKVNVNELNNKELEKLPGEEHIIESICRGISQEDAEAMFDIPKRLRLKIGAQVMLRVNLDTELVNGSRGVVVDITPSVVLVLFRNGETVSIEKYKWDHEEGRKNFYITQFPLILAWAITIHKSQGATLDYVQCDLGTTIFAAGQAYIALSRVRGLASLELEHLSRKKIFADPEALEFVNGLETYPTISSEEVVPDLVQNTPNLEDTINLIDKICDDDLDDLF